MIKLSNILREINEDSLKDLINYLNQNKANINKNLKYISNNGKLNSNLKDIYDFGGSWDPLPNSIVVDIDKPKGDNEFIEQDFENEFTLPSKKYINISSVIHFINNKSNIVKSINNSLENGGIFVIKTSLSLISEIIPYLSNYIPLEAKINEKEILSSTDDLDVISIAFQKQ
jgi:SAM-dependent methyltransferase